MHLFVSSCKLNERQIARVSAELGLDRSLALLSLSVFLDIIRRQRHEDEGYSGKHEAPSPAEEPEEERCQSDNRDQMSNLARRFRKSSCFSHNVTISNGCRLYNRRLFEQNSDQCGSSAI